jgi:putative ABC transport system permease protein
VIRYVLHALRAHWRAGRTLFVLTVLGVALGVASVLSIQILNGSALAAFRGGLQAIGGDADLSVLPRGPDLPDTAVPEVLAVAGVRAAWPVVQIPVTIAGEELSFLDVVGVDLLAPRELPFAGGETPDLSPALGEEGWAAVPLPLARRRGWKVGDTIRLASGSRAVPGAHRRPRGLLPPGADRRGEVRGDGRGAGAGPPRAPRPAAPRGRAGAAGLPGPGGGRRHRAQAPGARAGARPRAARAAGRGTPGGLSPEPHRALPHQPGGGRVPGLRRHAGGARATARGVRSAALAGGHARGGAGGHARRGGAARGAGRRHRPPLGVRGGPGQRGRGLRHRGQSLPPPGDRRRDRSGWMWALAVATGIGSALAGALLPALDLARRDPRSSSPPSPSMPARAAPPGASSCAGSPCSPWRVREVSPSPAVSR